MVSNHTSTETWDQPDKSKGLVQWLDEERDKDRHIDDRSMISLGIHDQAQQQQPSQPQPQPQSCQQHDHQAPQVKAKPKLRAKCNTEPMTMTQLTCHITDIDLEPLSLLSPSSSLSSSSSMSSSPVSADGMLRGGDDGSDIESDCTAVKGSYGTGVASVATNDGFGADTSAADPILFQPTCRRPGASTVNILQREHDEGMVAVAGAEATEPMSPCSSSGGHVLDEVLLLALKNRQDRLFLLRLDRKYCDFIQDKSRDHMEFPWLNSYYRLMIHRTADYFGLGRQVDVSHKRIRVFKTEHSTIPTLRFCDLVEHDDEDGQATCPQPAHQGNDAQDAHVAAMGANVEQHQVSQPEPQAQTRPAPTKVLKRSTPTRPISACESRCGESFIGTTNRRTMVSMEQREKAYAEARARIFCEEGKGAESFMGAKDQCTVTMEQKAYAAATVQVFGEDGKGAEPSASALDRNSMVSTEQQEQAIAEAKTRNIGENGKGKAKAEHQPVQQHHHTFAGVIGAQEEEAMTTSHLAEGCGRFALGEEIERTEAEHEVTKLELEDTVKPLTRRRHGSSGGVQVGLVRRTSTSSSTSTSSGTTTTEMSVLSPNGFQSPGSASTCSGRSGPSSTDYFNRHHYPGPHPGTMHGGSNGSGHHEQRRHSGHYQNDTRYESYQHGHGPHHPSSSQHTSRYGHTASSQQYQHHHASHSHSNQPQHQQAYCCNNDPRLHICPESYNHHCSCFHVAYTHHSRGHSQGHESRSSTHNGHSGQKHPRGADMDRRLPGSMNTGGHHHHQPIGYPHFQQQQHQQHQHTHYHGGPHGPSSNQNTMRYERAGPYHHPQHYAHNYYPQQPPYTPTAATGDFARCCDAHPIESFAGHGPTHEPTPQQSYQHPYLHQQGTMMERLEREEQAEGHHVPVMPGASPPSGGTFQVSVRPFSSSSGYRPYRQGISLPQQPSRQHHQQHSQHQQHQQQPHQPRRQHQHRSTRPPSSGTAQQHHDMSHDLFKGQAQSSSQTQTWRQRAAGRGDDKAAQIVYNVDRRPPKSTELYDPYAGGSSNSTTSRSRSSSTSTNTSTSVSTGGSTRAPK